MLSRAAQATMPRIVWLRTEEIEGSGPHIVYCLRCQWNVSSRDLANHLQVFHTNVANVGNPNGEANGGATGGAKRKRQEPEGEPEASD